MLIDDIPRWALGLILAYSGAVTAGSAWAVSHRRGGKPDAVARGRLAALRSMAGHAVWAVLLFSGGVLGVRYAERLATPAFGYAGLGLGLVAVSLVRAELYHWSLAQGSRTGRGGAGWLRELTAAVFSSVVYLLAAAVADAPVRLLLFIPLVIGAQLAGLADGSTLLGRMLPSIGWSIESRWGRDGRWRSLGANAVVGMVTAPLILLAGPLAWGLLSVGFACHLLLDLLRSEGVMLFWPLSQRRFNILGGPLGLGDDAPAGRLLVALCILAAVLLLAVDVSPSAPPTSAGLTYEQSLLRYQGLRGRTLVYADVTGTWQSSGRRVSARFEILGAEGESLILLDRYAGRMFSAGRSASDHLYIYSLSVVAGLTARVKPTEVILSDEDLASVLPILYAMQSEPGVEHILVSGDIVVAQGAAVEALPQSSLAQNRLRKIVRHEERHYVLRYLTASEVIALAGLPIASGELVVTATYVIPADGPTATPLPQAPTTGSGSLPQGSTP